MEKPVTTSSNTCGEGASGSASAPESTPPMVKLKRFIYLNNNQCAFVKLKPIDLNNISEQLNCILEMGDELPVTIIKKAYESKCCIRPNEALIALAYCIRQSQNPKLRALAYSEAGQFIKDQKDFLLFVKYSVEITRILHGNNRKGFGNGLRKMVTRWYAQYSPLQLAEIFGENRGQYNWTHRDVWKLAHVKCEETADRDRVMVVKFVFVNGQDYLKYLKQFVSNGGRLQAGAVRMKALQMFKTNESLPSAIVQIHKYGFKLKNSPPHLLHYTGIWDAFLPSLSYSELIDNLFTLKDLGHLKDGHPFYAEYLTALGKLENCTTSEPKINPIKVFILKRLYEKNVRYLTMAKSNQYEKKVEKRNLIPDTKVIKQLGLILNHSLLVNKPVSAKFFITIDLNTNSRRRFVVNNKHITCLEASLILALSIVKREIGAEVFTFTNDPNQINRLADLHDMTFEQAKYFYSNNCWEETRQNLKTPIHVAADEKRDVDVFITIVASVAEFMHSSANELPEFKLDSNTCAKYILVNLSRSTPGLSNNTADFMEICGFNENVPKIIDAFVQNAFQ